jgi:hypothetical protein
MKLPRTPLHQRLSRREPNALIRPAKKPDAGGLTPHAAGTARGDWQHRLPAGSGLEKWGERGGHQTHEASRSYGKKPS